MSGLIQPPSYASLRAQLNKSRAKAGLPDQPTAPEGTELGAEAIPSEAAGPAPALPGELPAASPSPSPPPEPAAPLEAAPRKPARRVADGATGGRKVYKFRVPVPVAAPGSEFAKLIDAYGEADAMGMILSSALDAWIGGYGAGAIVLDQPAYPVTGRAFGTTRRFPDALVADVRRRIDPYDRRADGFIAQRIAVSALSAWLAKG
ncbi:hypothetical protein [Amaricoccus solimangrovi]|uniref:Uncharacterized protein n=1 Tax=Amaricoccus solimangrovi TaxID=2589815 RepID=A0A501WLG6_9RHOB|nr:hypothetical protein [Amaricoccus solimangrovi]TPE47891.1 hypothetical protein FJM51_19345 [Amaricoccus solimangrovi]